MHWMRMALGLLAAVVVSVGCSSSTSGLPGSDAGPTQTVSGTVWSYEGVPASNDTVIITSGAFKATTATDSNGAFTVHGVPVPYDVWLIASVVPSSVRYIGLTRPDPTLNDLLSRTSQARTANLSGQLTGGTYPEPAGVETRLVFASPETLSAVDYLFSNVDHSADGSFASPIQWQGPAATTGTLFALQIQTALQGEFLPTQYSYGSLSGVSLEDTGTLSGQTVTLASVPTAQMSVTVAEKSGYTFSEESVQLSVAPNVALTIILSGDVLTTPMTFAAPEIASTSLAVSANATNDAGAFIEATQTGLMPDASVVLSVPDPPEALTPDDGATEVGYSTTFSWTGYPNGLYMLEVFPEKYGTAFFIFTAATSATIPDFNALTGTTKFTWYVVGAAPLTSMDDLATPDHLDAFYNGQLHSPFPGVIPHSPGNLTVGVSAPRSFSPP
jgi:hypothetical protein